MRERGKEGGRGGEGGGVRITSGTQRLLLPRRRRLRLMLWRRPGSRQVIRPDLLRAGFDKVHTRIHARTHAPGARSAPHAGGAGLRGAHTRRVPSRAAPPPGDQR